MSDRRTEKDNQSGANLAVAEPETRSRVKPPRLYEVLLLNDDFTPMDFVVEVLESVFAMQRTRATQVMLEVHLQGKGSCGVYSYEIAETKVAQVMSIANRHQHPLLCTMEEV